MLVKAITFSLISLLSSFVICLSYFSLTSIDIISSYWISKYFPVVKMHTSSCDFIFVIHLLTNHNQQSTIHYFSFVSLLKYLLFLISLGTLTVIILQTYHQTGSVRKIPCLVKRKFLCLQYLSNPLLCLLVNSALSTINLFFILLSILLLSLYCH